MTMEILRGDCPGSRFRLKNASAQACRDELHTALWWKGAAKRHGCRRMNARAVFQVLPTATNNWLGIPLAPAQAAIHGMAA